MIKGLDILGFMHPKFPLQLLIEELPKGWAIGILRDPKAFGIDDEKLGRLLVARPDIPMIRVHGHWDGNHNAKEAIIPIPKLEKQLKEMEVLAKLHNARSWCYSHSLEYNCSSRAKVEARIRRIRELAPNCHIVQSCMKGYSVANLARERHGDAVSEFVSTDGIDIWDINAKGWLQRNREATACFAWIHSFNGRKKGVTPKPYKQRTDWPTRAEIRKVIKVMS